MTATADAFVALPGGAGTLEEMFEAWTWAQLGHHNKPCAFYNVNGFYTKLRDMVACMVELGFLKAPYPDMLIYTDDPQELLSAIRAYEAPQIKWK